MLSIISTCIKTSSKLAGNYNGNELSLESYNNTLYVTEDQGIAPICVNIYTIETDFNLSLSIEAVASGTAIRKFIKLIKFQHAFARGIEVILCSVKHLRNFTALMLKVCMNRESTIVGFKYAAWRNDTISDK